MQSNSIKNLFTIFYQYPISPICLPTFSFFLLFSQHLSSTITPSFFAHFFFIVNLCLIFSFLPSFLSSFLPHFLPVFLPSFLPSSSIPSFLPSSSIPSFLPSFIPTFYLPSFLFWATIPILHQASESTVSFSNK